jgi:hypothetical protein
MRGDAEDPDPAGGMLDDGQDLHCGAGQCRRTKKSAAMIAWA